MANKPRVILPPFHPQQQKVHDNKARFKVVAAGRRFGKSWYARMEVLDEAINRGGVVWWVSPTYNNVSTHWRATLRQVGTRLPSYRNIQQKLIEFHSPKNDLFGEVSFKSADKPDNLRGEGLDLCVIDEAAFIDGYLWDAVIRPALADKHGRAIIISTPNGEGDWFHKSFLRGLNPDDLQWASFRFPLSANPTIPDVEAEVADAKMSMSALRFEQEIMAEFISNSGGVFLDIDEACVNPAISRGYADHDYIIGIDLGRKHDYTAINVLDITDRQNVKQVYGERFTEFGFSTQMNRILRVYEAFGRPVMYIEKNSIGMPIVEGFQEQGIKVRPIFTSWTNKGPMIESVAANIQHGRLTLLSQTDPYGAVQAGEMKAYTMSQTKDGNIKYYASSGFHDDTVMSLAMSGNGIPSRSGARLTFGPNPFY